MPRFPDVRETYYLAEPEGNVFVLVGLVGKAIEKKGHDSMPFFEEVGTIMESGGKYEDVLAFIQKTVNATFVR